MSNKIQYWCCVFDFSNVFFQMYHFSSILNKNFRISHSNTFVKILSILLRIDLFYLNKTADKAVLFHFTHKCIWSTQLCSIIENLLRWELSFESQCRERLERDWAMADGPAKNIVQKQEPVKRTPEKQKSLKHKRVNNAIFTSTGFWWCLVLLSNLKKKQIYVIFCSASC